jgi:L-lactate dehydrogenase complex protein LldF
MSVPLKPENFKALVAERLFNAQLRRNLGRATQTALAKRLVVVGDYDDWEERRRIAHNIKKLVIEHLPAYLSEFERNAEAAGAKIIHASTAQEARNAVLDIVRRNGGTLAVKSKSMVTEEIGLTHTMNEVGIETVETDLGEYIVQLAGQIPSHITAPALHFSKEEVGELFADKLGIPYTSDPKELTAIARKVLRQKFLDASVGLSGVNAGIAETGSICIVENEGNARLSTTLPRVHIAVMGIEKLLPDMRSLTHVLNMLARSATGQRISSYTSIITGPRKTGEKDGPDELYIVVLDNGRSTMLADPRLREALFCIRCGACLNTCPVYQKIGGHSYGSIYPGPIGAVITPCFYGLRSARYLPYASSLCGSCSEICPMHLDLHHLLLERRRQVAANGCTPFIERAAMRAGAVLLKHPWMYRLAGAMGRTFGPLLADANGSLPVPGWTRSRDFPKLAPYSFHSLWKEHANARRDA